MKLHAKRTSLVLATAAMLCVGPIVAQSTAPTKPPAAPDAPPPSPDGGGPRRKGPEHRVERLQQALNLTPDQTTQVEALFETERTRMEALRSGGGEAPADRRSQMMAIHQDTEAKMHSILTPDQVARYDAMQARMRDHRRDGGPPQPPYPPSAPPPPPPPGV